MSGVLALMALMAGKLQTLLGVGSNGAGIYGYFATEAYGSMGRTTFTDGGGATRTVIAIHWDIAANGFPILRLSGASIANSDATFRSLRIGGVVLARSSASYVADDGSGNSRWLWSVDTSAYPTSGSVQIILD